MRQVVVVFVTVVIICHHQLLLLPARFITPAVQVVVDASNVPERYAVTILSECAAFPRRLVFFLKGYITVAPVLLPARTTHGQPCFSCFHCMILLGKCHAQGSKTHFIPAFQFCLALLECPHCIPESGVGMSMPGCSSIAVSIALPPCSCILLRNLQNYLR